METLLWIGLGIVAIAGWLGRDKIAMQNYVNQQWRASNKKTASLVEILCGIGVAIGLYAALHH